MKQLLFAAALLLGCSSVRAGIIFTLGTILNRTKRMCC